MSSFIRVFYSLLLFISLCVISSQSDINKWKTEKVPPAVDMLFPKGVQTHGHKTRCPPCSHKRKPAPVCEATADIGFAVESSTSLGRVGPGNLRRLIHFVGLVARKFQLSKERTRVGLITYSSKPRLLFKMTERVGKIIEGLKKGIKSKYSDPSSNTGKALKFAQKQLFSDSQRFNKVLVVITDGRSNDTITEASKSLKRHGVKILCVGVGRYFDIHQLNEMASRPVNSNVFVGDFTKLFHLRDLIVKTVCHGIGGHLHSYKRPCLCKTG